MPDVNVIENAYGDPPYRIRAFCLRCGGDVSVTVLGGTGPHVGAVSLGLYEPDRDSATVSTITAPGHRDDAVSARYAKVLARELKRTVSVSAGVHIDGAAPREIELLTQNCEQCLQGLLEQIKSEGAGA